MIGLAIFALACLGAARVLKLAWYATKGAYARACSRVSVFRRRVTRKRAPKVDVATAILALAASIAAIAHVASGNGVQRSKRIP